MPHGKTQKASSFDGAFFLRGANRVTLPAWFHTFRPLLEIRVIELEKQLVEQGYREAERQLVLLLQQVLPNVYYSYEHKYSPKTCSSEKPTVFPDLRVDRLFVGSAAVVIAARLFFDLHGKSQTL